MRFRIDLKIFLIAIIFCLTKQIHIYMLMMIFVFIHELGHLLAGIILKMKPSKIEIIPVGVSISFKIKTDDLNKKIGKATVFELKKIFVALAGPLTNLMIIIIVLNLPIDIMKQISIIYANLFILIFNMIPIYPLDGGRITKGILNVAIGKQKANNYTNILSIISTIILTVLACLATWFNNNIAIMLIIVYIWTLVIKENKMSRDRERVYKLLSKNY